MALICRHDGDLCAAYTVTEIGAGGYIVFLRKTVVGGVSGGGDCCRDVSGAAVLAFPNVGEDSRRHCARLLVWISHQEVLRSAEDRPALNENGLHRLLSNGSG